MTVRGVLRGGPRRGRPGLRRIPSTRLRPTRRRRRRAPSWIRHIRERGRCDARRARAERQDGRRHRELLAALGGDLGDHASPGGAAASTSLSSASSRRSGGVAVSQAVGVGGEDPVDAGEDRVGCARSTGRCGGRGAVDVIPSASASASAAAAASCAAIRRRTGRATPLPPSCRYARPIARAHIIVSA